MAANQVVPGVWQVPIRYVNAFLVQGDDGLTLIDTGFPGGEPTLLRGLESIGKTPADVKRILVTHCHSDHSGGLAELKRLSNAPAFMHPLDAALVRKGLAMRPLTPAPGLINALICKFLMPDAPTEIEPVAIDHEVNDGDAVPGDFRAIQVPGHCAGQLAFLHEPTGVLFAADAAAHVFGLALSPLYEDLETGRRSLGRLSALDFRTAVFGHGKPILKDASAQFAARWPPARQPARTD